jgi:hypothetical protein
MPVTLSGVSVKKDEVKEEGKEFEKHVSNPNRKTRKKKL